jgi:hypothetical protein
MGFNGIINLSSSLFSVRLVRQTHPLSTPSMNRFRRHRFRPTIICHDVRLYFRRSQRRLRHDG